MKYIYVHVRSNILCALYLYCIRDKFWSENKRVLEESSPRYMGVSCKDVVPFTITNLPSDEISCISVQIHPQKPEHGLRVMVSSYS